MTAPPPPDYGDYEEPDEFRKEYFARKFNRAELTLNIDELMR